MFVSTPPITNIESLYQSTILSLGSGLSGRNIYDVNIQQQTTSEVADTETMMADNEELYTPSPQDLSYMFVVVDLLSCSSSDSAEYKQAWLKAKLIHHSILSAG